jgi:hypothetical protein
MTTNNTQGLMVTCSTSSSSSCEAYVLVSAIPAGTNSAYPKIIIQPVRKPAARPSPRLL